MTRKNLLHGHISYCILLSYNTIQSDKMVTSMLRWELYLHFLGDVINLDNYMMNLHFVKASSVIKVCCWKPTNRLHSSGTADKSMPEKPAPPPPLPPTHTHSHKHLHTVLELFAALNTGKVIFTMHAKTHVGVHVKCSCCCPILTKSGLCWQSLISTLIGSRVVCYTRTGKRMYIRTDKRGEYNRRILAPLRCDAPKKRVRRNWIKGNRRCFESVTEESQRIAV